MFVIMNQFFYFSDMEWYLFGFNFYFSDTNKGEQIWYKPMFSNGS